ncbi:hypothetical protein M8C21_017648 [Ambrosia artemisiifolia]|uniref:Uncharacterized protein n=1 Tax=Ambrosia artemisiifolia TaxID=4212 RepID=A0AAD5GHM8_AMBAR|nr:hypothetical protein M8C21_017648 [Ambrosia artemisiifolia]
MEDLGQKWLVYSGEKKHVMAGMAIIGVIFGLPWYLMNRDTNVMVSVMRLMGMLQMHNALAQHVEKQTVKEGQLGGELPIESDIAGEVIKTIREDGDPSVGYGDALIAILPSFSRD